MAALDKILDVVKAVGLIAPQVPQTVGFLEGLFGHSKETGVKSGPQRLELGVTILQNVLAALANAGQLQPATAALDSPELRAALAGAIQQAVDAAKAAGGGAAIPVVPVPSAPTATVPLEPNKSYVFTGTFHAVA